MVPTIDGKGASPRNLLIALLGALDLLTTGVAVTSRNGRLLFINRTAEEILQAGDGLEITENEVLQMSVEACPLPIRKMLTPGIRQPVPRGVNGMTASIHRPSGKRPLTVAVWPTTSIGERLGGEKAEALVFILDPERPVGASQSDLHQLYGLTSAESNLANCLMEGKRLNDCCRQLRIRMPAARMHLRNLFRKTGTRKQSELVWLLFNNYGLFSADANQLTYASALATLSRN